MTRTSRGKHGLQHSERMPTWLTEVDAYAGSRRILEAADK